MTWNTIPNVLYETSCNSFATMITLSLIFVSIHLFTFVHFAHVGQWAYSCPFQAKILLYTRIAARIVTLIKYQWPSDFTQWL